MSGSSTDIEYRLDTSGVRTLFKTLSSLDYCNIGPVARDGAIMLEKLSSFDDLALGYHEKQGQGSYNLVQQDDNSFFQYTLGPQSFKKFLHPPRRKLWSAHGSSKEFNISLPKDPPKMAFWGVRNCDIASINILDNIFLNGTIVNDWYEKARTQLFIVAVGCTHPSQNCFCTSMGSGPMPHSGYDIVLTEVKNEQEHFFIAKANSGKAKDLIEACGSKQAQIEEVTLANVSISKAREQMSVKFDPLEAAQILRKNPEHQHWDEVANRCLSCANCTMVCPTCFCSTTEDITDITGDHTERWLSWDSCFNGDFSYIHGGQIRNSTKSRYRQWMTHKLSSWYDQFGSSGCVGCGRCISWCPVGIDITEELLAIRDQTETV